LYHFLNQQHIETDGVNDKDMIFVILRFITSVGIKHKMWS